jgi:hypothetical protein
MEGVGAIFEAYRDGALQDDDEVAVVVGPPEMDYASLSEAIVNIRATLARAEAEGIIEPATRAVLETIAKDLFYPERSYPLLLKHAAGLGLPQGELDALQGWLPAGRIDQKREDALAMLRVIRQRLAEGLPSKHVTFSFEETVYWDNVRRYAGELQLDGDADANTVLGTAVLEELRLEGSYSTLQQQAMLRLLALDEARRQNMAVTPEDLEAVETAFRRGQGLIEEELLERWKERHHLDDGRFRRLLQEEVLFDRLRERRALRVMTYLPEYLHANGIYSRLFERARDKQRSLESRGLENPGLSDAGIPEDGLLHWYFERRLGRPVPADVAYYARSEGFGDRAAFIRALLREYCYLEGNSAGAENETACPPAVKAILLRALAAPDLTGDRGTHGLD